MQIASEGLKGRVFECNLADLQSVSAGPSACLRCPASSCSMRCSHVLPVALQNEADAYRKIRLRAEDVQGRKVLTNFWVSSTGPATGIYTRAVVSPHVLRCPIPVHHFATSSTPSARCAFVTARRVICAGHGFHDGQAAVVGAKVADAD